MIPNIIHQTGPTNSNQWHPLWFKCQESWHKCFSDFEYKFWTDEQLDELVKNNYPEYWEMYQMFPVHIMKIDFARLCIMDCVGGIYADLDYYCYKNFKELLNKDCYVVENPYGNDPIENSLLCSKPNSSFFKKCLEKTKQRFYYIKDHYPDNLDFVSKISNNFSTAKKLRPYLIFYISGTNLISSVFRENKNLVSLLDGFVFNNLDYSYDESFFCKHIHTGTWGKEDIKNPHLLNYFATIRNIPVDQYNFFVDYSNGSFKSSYKMDYDKNDCEQYINLNVSHNYC